MQEVPGPGGRPPVRWSSTSSGSVSAAPTSSSSPARWPTCTPATRRTRCGSATSGPARSPRSETAWTRPGSAAASWATPCSATAPAGAAARGHQHVCEHRQEVGIRGGRPGALAEQLAVPVVARCTPCRTPSTQRSARWSSRAATPCAPQRPPHSSPATGLWCSARAPSACWPRCSRGRTGPRCT